MLVNKKLDEVVTILAILAVLITFGSASYIQSEKDSYWEYYGEVVSYDDTSKYIKVVKPDNKIEKVWRFRTEFYLSDESYVEYNRLSREYRCYLGGEYVR